MDPATQLGTQNEGTGSREREREDEIGDGAHRVGAVTTADEAKSEGDVRRGRRRKCCIYIYIYITAALRFGRGRRRPGGERV